MSLLRVRQRVLVPRRLKPMRGAIAHAMAPLRVGQFIRQRAVFCPATFVLAEPTLRRIVRFANDPAGASTFGAGATAEAVPFPVRPIPCLAPPTRPFDPGRGGLSGRRPCRLRSFGPRRKARALRMTRLE